MVSTETPEIRVQRMIQDTFYLSVRCRNKLSAGKSLELAYWLHSSRLYGGFLVWRRKASKLLNKLCLPENRDYWRSALPYERNTKEYHNWRIECLSRDNWVCKQCDTTKELSVHHIKSYKDNHELRLEIDNGITLCKKCHKKEHKGGYSANNN